MSLLSINQQFVGEGQPTYFIADISANHDGDLERAKTLIHLAANAGADAAKFQNFRADKIVSEYGFAALKKPLSHQATWKKPVYQTYQDASLPWEWTEALKLECDAAGIAYLSTPYDLEAVDMLDPHVSAFKIGSGDITWSQLVGKVAFKNKPIILSTGASDICDVRRAVHLILAVHSMLVLLQCNTNYTTDSGNFKHIHLNVLKTYRVMFPKVILGLSDHTLGYVTVLGAVTLGASVIEKHFTDDANREGPDHPFSVTPIAWREMVDRTRELECALGSTDKRVATNEYETVVAQRRCLRAAKDLKVGTILTRELIDVLRPAPPEAISPQDLSQVTGLRLRVDVPRGEYFHWMMFEHER